MINLDARVPDGPIADKWDNHKFSIKLVNPNNKRKFDVIVVGTDWRVRQPPHPWLSWATT